MLTPYVQSISLEQAVYVMPSTSGRAASHPRRVDKLKFFHELKQLRDNLLAKHGSVRVPSDDTGIPPAQDSSGLPSVSHSLQPITALTGTPTPVSMVTTPVVPLPPVVVGKPGGVMYTLMSTPFALDLFIQCLELIVHFAGLRFIC